MAMGSNEAMHSSGLHPVSAKGHSMFMLVGSFAFCRAPANSQLQLQAANGHELANCRETLEALRRAPELPSRLGAPARAQLFKCLLHESAPALLLTALKLEACGELEYLPTVLLDILRHGTR